MRLIFVYIFPPGEIHLCKYAKDNMDKLKKRFAKGLLLSCMNNNTPHI